MTLAAALLDDVQGRARVARAAAPLLGVQGRSRVAGGGLTASVGRTAVLIPRVAAVVGRRHFRPPVGLKVSFATSPSQPFARWRSVLLHSETSPARFHLLTRPISIGRRRQDSWCQEPAQVQAFGPSPLGRFAMPIDSCRGGGFWVYLLGKACASIARWNPSVNLRTARRFQTRPLPTTSTTTSGQAGHARMSAQRCRI